MEKFENVTYFNHPLIQHKISILRKKETGTNEFRHLGRRDCYAGRF